MRVTMTDGRQLTGTLLAFDKVDISKPRVPINRANNII